MYKLVGNILPNGVVEIFQQVRRLSDDAIIPFDEGNMDYRSYLEWVAEGNEPETWDAE